MAGAFFYPFAGAYSHFACRRGGAFCKSLNCAPARRGIVCGRLSAGQGLLQGLISTARRGGLPFAPAKGSKTGQSGTKLSPLQTPLTLSCAGYEYCFSLNNREKQIRTAHRCAPKVAAGASAPTALRCPKKSLRCSLARFFRPLRVLRLAASASGGARLRTPYPSPVAGEGPSGQIAAYSGLRLGSVTFCYWFAVTPIKCAAGTLRAYLRRCTDDAKHRWYPAAV